MVSLKNYLIDYIDEGNECYQDRMIRVVDADGDVIAEDISIEEVLDSKEDFLNSIVDTVDNEEDVLVVTLN